MYEKIIAVALIVAVALFCIYFVAGLILGWILSREAGEKSTVWERVKFAICWAKWIRGRAGILP